ncbi:MAG: phenylacetate--CoA ligase, partial [Spirochaetes bacterium]
MIDVYRDREIETMDREALAALQLLRFKKAVKTALKTPFYKDRLNGVGIKSAEDLKSLKDIQKIPFTTKEDLRAAYPYG